MTTETEAEAETETTTRRAALDARRLHELVEACARQFGVVGAQVSVYADGGTVDIAVGCGNVETGVPVTTGTLIQVGSTTKVHTATLAMQLVDAGLVALDAPVTEYLPGVPLSSDPSSDGVTLRHLLAMTSGLDNGPYAGFGRGDDAVERYVATLATLEPMAAPGELFGYTNASTVVAGRVIEQVCGAPWDRVLHESLLEPAGLFDSETLPERLMWRRFAVGHELRAGEAEPSVVRQWGLPPALAPAGSTLCASAADLVRFARIFLDDGVAVTGNRVLSPAAVREMHSAQTAVPATGMADAWGVGPYRKQWGDDVVHGHSGTNSGGSSVLLWVPSKRVAVATVVNTPERGYPFADAVFSELFPGMLGIAKPAPLEPRSDIAVDPEPLIGTYRSLGATTVVEWDGERLLLEVVPTGAEARVEPTRCELLPLGDRRFLPADPAVTGGRHLAVAFVGPAERASHFVNFVFLAKRTDR